MRPTNKNIKIPVTKTDNILEEIRKKITGDRSVKLTPVEINNLFKLPITPEFNLILYRALENSEIDPNVTILQAIGKAFTKDYLIPIALCLRFGANANMYVDAPDIGIVHILGYTYILLSKIDKNVLNAIVILLIMSGSLPTLAMFKDDKITITASLMPSLTVLEWLNKNGYLTILNQVSNKTKLQQFVSADALTTLSIYLNKPNIGRKYEARDSTAAIRSFSNKIDEIPLSNIMIMMDNKSLNEAVTSFNSDAFNKLMLKGLMPSYLLINKILIGLIAYKKLGDFLVEKELTEMLTDALAFGITLDDEQMNIVKNNGIIIDTKIEVPYWKQVCKVNDNLVTDELKNLAISLNIDSGSFAPSRSKKFICDNITAIANADQNALIEAFRKKQQLKMAAKLGTVNEFINDVPTLVCRNKASLSKDIFDYDEIDVAYYRDEQGAIWCFTSDMFHNLVETGVNPYNDVNLPLMFKDEIRHRLTLNEQLLPPVTFVDSINNLSTVKITTNNNNERILNNFLSKIGYKEVSNQKLMDSLKEIGYQVNLAPLSNKHALITVAILLDYLERTDSVTAKRFYLSVNK